MAVAATGFFDGVHLGHRNVMETLLRLASERKEQSLILTFWPHPRTVLRDGARDLRLLSSQDEKLERLRDSGVDRVEVLPFTKDFAAMTAREYLQMLAADYGVTAIVLGYDNRFGSDGLTTDQIVSVAAGLGIAATVVHPCNRRQAVPDDTHGRPWPCEWVARQSQDGARSAEGIRQGAACDVHDAPQVISSTEIRKALASGDVRAASEMLGYDYELRGVVVSGNMMGRTIGFPTANMKLREPLKCIPGVGAYVSDVWVDGRKMRGMTNIDHNGKIETHILDFSEDIYGMDIRVSFISKLRDEQHFNSFEDLKKQLQKDIEMVRNFR